MATKATLVQGGDGTAIVAGMVGEILTQTFTGKTIAVTLTELCTFPSVTTGTYLVIVDAQCAKDAATRIIGSPQARWTGTATCVWPAQITNWEWLAALDNNYGQLQVSIPLRVTTAGTIIVNVIAFGGSATSGAGRVQLLRIA